MKNKLATALIFIALSYGLPLMGNIKLFLSIQISLLICIALVIFISQPPLRLADVQQAKEKDKYSVVLISLAAVACQALSTTEWGYFRTSTHSFLLDALTIVGISVMAIGVLFRIWCIYLLGEFFTTTVQTNKQQSILKKGPYSILRHPSYLGAYLAFIGSTLVLHAYIGLIFSALVMFAAYSYRIKVEEMALAEEFGEEYVEYQSKTKQFLPFIY